MSEYAFWALVVLLCFAGCDECSGARRNARELVAPYKCNCAEPTP